MKQLLPPQNKFISEVSRLTGVTKQTLRAWKKSAKASEYGAPTKSASSTAWSSEDKFMVVLETATMNQSELSAYCRQKGLFTEQVAHWRNHCMSVNGGINDDNKALKQTVDAYKKSNKELAKELKRKESALAETAALLVMKKKAQAIWGGKQRTKNSGLRSQNGYRVNR